MKRVQQMQTGTIQNSQTFTSWGSAAVLEEEEQIGDEDSSAVSSCQSGKLISTTELNLDFQVELVC